LFGKASVPKALLPGLLNALPYLTGSGDKSFLDQIKDRLGIRTKGRKIHGNEDEYQLREGQTDYGGWQDLENENTFDWNLAN
jgi:hypothetical protein